MAFHTKNHWVQKPLLIRFDKLDGLIEIDNKIR